MLDRRIRPGQRDLFFEPDLLGSVFQPLIAQRGQFTCEILAVPLQFHDPTFGFGLLGIARDCRAPGLIDRDQCRLSELLRKRRFGLTQSVQPRVQFRPTLEKSALLMQPRQLIGNRFHCRGSFP